MNVLIDVTWPVLFYSVRDSCVSFTFGEFPFSISTPAAAPPSFLSLQCKEMVYYERMGKRVETYWTKISLIGCKWSSSAAHGSHAHIPWCH